MTRVRTQTVVLNQGSPVTVRIFLPPAGKGPGLLLLTGTRADEDWAQGEAELFADEGYTVMLAAAPAAELAEGPLPGASADGSDVIEPLVRALRERPEVVGQIGVVGFGAGGPVALHAAVRSVVSCAVACCPEPLAIDPAELAKLRVPVTIHAAGSQLAADDPPASARAALEGHGHCEIHDYPGVETGFFHVGDPRYDAPASRLAHQRSVGRLRRAMGPHFDFSTLWDQHCACEFATRDVDATMATMVERPYVNHIPTMTGGVGHDQLKRFYKYHFIPKTPADTRLIPISRTVGETGLVDELLFCFTHDIEMDWMLPGIPPTGRRVEIPLVAIVRFRGDRLYNEHIYWDQASVLVQIGRLDPTGLPVAGVETARKLLDETRPSNTLMARWDESESQPL